MKDDDQKIKKYEVVYEPRTAPVESTPVPLSFQGVSRQLMISRLERTVVNTPADTPPQGEGIDHEKLQRELAASGIDIHADAANEKDFYHESNDPHLKAFLAEQEKMAA